MITDQEFKTTLCEALRSGQYEQCTGYLSKRDAATGDLSFCCLGVSLDINDDVEWEDGTNVPAREGLPTDFTVRNAVIAGARYMGNSTEESLCRAFPMMTKEDVKTLMRLNDSGQSFAQIADYIEKYL